jgi:hypothetical protein
MVRNLSILFFLALSSGLYGQKQVPAKHRILKEWTLSPDRIEEEIIPIDTVFSLFHRYRLADRYSAFNAMLGNYGLPFYQINFFDRVTDPDEFLYAYYYPLMHVPTNAVFMNTQVPFTEAVWTYGEPRETSEQTFRIRHSQNVNRYFNFGLIYDIIYSLGQYNYQRAEDKTFTFYSSYTGPRYKMYFSTGINNITSYENGGITSADQLPLYETRDVPVNLGGLNKAVSILKNRNIMIVQRYTLGKPARPKDTTEQKQPGVFGLSGTFSHILTWETNKRTYSDSYPGAGYYDTIYLISKASTFDSLYSRSFKNTIRFDFATNQTRKFRLGGGVGLRNELFRYSQIVPTQSIPASEVRNWNKSNNVIVGRLFNDIGEKFRWTATGELFFTGYRVGDFSLKGLISESFLWKKGPARWDITGGVENIQPSFWFEQWGGNIFEWHNNFLKEFRIDLGTRYSYPARKTDLKFNYAIIDNYTDFNTYALPSQHTGGLSVASLTVSKEFIAWKFHFSTDLLIQESSNPDILNLPLFTTRTAGFFEHLFRFKQTNGKLNVQLGADVTYHTNYYAYSYMPATGRFYRQDLIKTGNYPFINVFLNLKIKRTRFLLMYDHVNHGLMGNNYFMVPSYPMNVRMLRYGLAWTFYN